MPVTCSWIPLPPTGTPSPGVGGVTSAGGAPAGSTTAAPSAGGSCVAGCCAAAVAAGSPACGACAAAGVSPAAARTIAHPISFIRTFEDTGLGLGPPLRGPRNGAAYRRGFSCPQAPVPHGGRPVLKLPGDQPIH